MFKLKIVSAAVTGGNHADVIAQYLNRQRMSRIANQQHAAGQFRHGDNLPYDTFVANDRLTFIYAINAAFIDNDLIAVRIVNR
ncbi:Uncharacterised protein [Salmonella enterica subsp. enterica serovar Bovismorbificans]|uniref:Uncharacterized protein n=1 Tax=Salmonella enterica subsp. enterica serovar Bovismorbificans TaxID=58097 RepID=A0A655E260_SALET|nr:Uncharacterised protein [Salmonella enterica subsp. enterica serovar Bovismorbificans]